MHLCKGRAAHKGVAADLRHALEVELAQLRALRKRVRCDLQAALRLYAAQRTAAAERLLRNGDHAVAVDLGGDLHLAHRAVRSRHLQRGALPLFGIEEGIFQAVQIKCLRLLLEGVHVKIRRNARPRNEQEGEKEDENGKFVLAAADGERLSAHARPLRRRVEGVPLLGRTKIGARAALCGRVNIVAVRGVQNFRAEFAALLGEGDLLRGNKERAALALHVKGLRARGERCAVLVEKRKAHGDARHPFRTFVEKTQQQIAPVPLSLADEVVADDDRPAPLRIAVFSLFEDLLCHNFLSFLFLLPATTGGMSKSSSSSIPTATAKAMPTLSAEYRKASP